MASISGGGGGGGNGGGGDGAAAAATAADAHWAGELMEAQMRLSLAGKGQCGVELRQCFALAGAAGASVGPCIHAGQDFCSCITPDFPAGCMLSRQWDAVGAGGLGCAEAMIMVSAACGRGDGGGDGSSLDDPESELIDEENMDAKPGPSAMWAAAAAASPANRTAQTMHGLYLATQRGVQFPGVLAQLQGCAEDDWVGALASIAVQLRAFRCKADHVTDTISVATLPRAHRQCCVACAGGSHVHCEQPLQCGIDSHARKRAQPPK